MAYTPTEWISGSKITAPKLNNIERGVESVNSEYTPTTWAEGDTVTAAKLNKIEQGIADASGGGSSDFSTAEVTVINDTLDVTLYAPCYFDGGVDDGADCVTASGTNKIILYKGIAYAKLSASATVVVTGSIEVEDTYITITGDGTITLS